MIIIMHIMSDMMVLIVTGYDEITAVASPTAGNNEHQENTEDC